MPLSSRHWKWAPASSATNFTFARDLWVLAFGALVMAVSGARVSGCASSFAGMVTVAVVGATTRASPVAPERVTVKVSAPSLAASSVTTTGTVLDVSPAAKARVCEISSKSPALALLVTVT